MIEQRHRILTIGHSTHSLDVFVRLLQQHSVSALADVRSSPFSRFSPQFNRDALDRELKAYGIKYVFLGRELGARSDDPSCYANGRVQYSRLSQKPAFKEGIERLKKGSGEHVIALMCAEREPLECHRTLLVSRALEQQGLTVDHIHSDGGLERHRDAMDRLLDVVGLPREDLFRTKEDLMAEATIRQEDRIAYRSDDDTFGGSEKIS